MLAQSELAFSNVAGVVASVWGNGTIRLTLRRQERDEHPSKMPSGAVSFSTVPSDTTQSSVHMNILGCARSFAKIGQLISLHTSYCVYAGWRNIDIVYGKFPAATTLLLRATLPMRSLRRRGQFHRRRRAA